ncbi:MAG: hypothetical protein H3C51_00930 [Rubellimicrobium sp.]|nr:hypothetical protein [Rubellimicrobium sp.]
MSGFNILAVAQAGRLQYEAVLLAASLRRAAPAFAGRLFIAEPQPGPLWPDDPRLPDVTRRALQSLDAVILPFESRHFGAGYPHGNKIEALAALPAGEPFLFLDTDTLILGDIGAVAFDFARPSASMRREGTWPKLLPGGPGLAAVWGALYRRFGMDFAASQDRRFGAGDWRRYLYFNAGWFFGADPAAFGARFADYAVTIRDDPPPELAGQSLDPWLDQVALPLVVHALGGGRPGPELAGMDGAVTCHWRLLPLLYARESDAAVAMLESITRDPGLAAALTGWAALERMSAGDGARARALFDRGNLPPDERDIRQRLRRAGLWVR